MRSTFRTGLVVVSAMLMGACASEAPLSPLEASLSKGVSNPGTPVGASFTITTEATTIVSLITGQPRNGGQLTNDYCANGAYMKYRNNTQSWEITGANPHAQCTQSITIPGSTITITFSAVANYVLSTNGNVQLNFQDLPVLDEFSGACLYNCTPRYVHYKKNSNSRDGAGAIVGFGTDGSQWTIGLSQFAGSGIGGLAPSVRAFTGLATEVGGAERTGTATFTW